MLPFACSAFLAFGVVLVLVGASQPAIASELDLSLQRSGLLVSALALGIGVGVVAAGPASDRLPRRPLFVGAALLAAAALLGVGPGMSFARAFTHVALLGLAIGVHETLLNASIAERHAGAAAKPVVLAHAAVTIGATLAPLALGWLARDAHWSAGFHATGAAYASLAAVSLLVPFQAPPGPAPGGAPLRAVLHPAILPFALVGFAYVGVEGALTVFAIPYARALDLAPERGLAAISALWLGLLAGRLALLGVRRRIDAGFLVGAGLAGALVLGAGVGARLPWPEIVFGTGGFVLGFVFPVMIALAAERFPEARGTASGLVAGAAALGGFAIPWLHGALGDRAGVAASLTALAFWSLVVALAAGLALRESGR